MSNLVFDEFEFEAYPEGYKEVLADCTVLAANLLKMAINQPPKGICS